MKNWFKENKILILILVLALVIRLAFAFVSNIPWWDESVYLNLGHDLSINPFDYSVAGHGWSDFIPSGGDANYSYPRMGFRPPLLPYILALFYFLKLSFLIKLIIPIFGTLTVFLVYIFGKDFFDKKTGLISATIFSLIPIHVIFSGKVLNDVLVTFFILLAFLLFWKGFEKGDNKSKILFGIVMGISLLARYTTMWIFPIFIFYFLIKDKSFKFLKDKHFWYAIVGFFAVLIPWFIYGYFEYGNIFGAFIHGFKGAAYWGGSQSWKFFFQNHWHIFSVSGILFVLALAHLFISEDYKKKRIYLLLIWILFYFAMLVIMPHKEARFIIPIVPAMSLVLGYSLNKVKNYRKLIFEIILLILLFSSINILIDDSKISLNTNSKCFLETMDFFKNVGIDYMTISENPSIVRYYTGTESAFYPDKISNETLREIVNSTDKKVYFVFSRLNSGFETDKWMNLKSVLEEDYTFEFECSLDTEVNFVYSAN